MGNLWDWLAHRFGDRTDAAALEHAEARDLGDYMLEKGYASFDQVETARKESRSTRGDLLDILIEMGLNPCDLYEAKAQELRVPFVDLTVYKPDQGALTAIPEDMAKRHNVLPIKKDGNTLYVAMADLNNVAANDGLRLASRCMVRGVLAIPEAIADSIARLYSGEAANETAIRAGGASVKNVVTDIADADIKASMAQAKAEYEARYYRYLLDDRPCEDDPREVEKWRRIADNPVRRLANAIIQQAVRERASDVHIEPDRRGLRIRFRIDGVLHEVLQAPKFIQSPLMQRYRVMAEMDLATHRGKPQQGYIGIRYLEKDYSLEVNATPAFYGDKLTFKITAHEIVSQGLNNLGFAPEVQAKLEDLAQQPFGLLLFAGPHGSGRSTTQYTLLNKLNCVDRHLLTIEPYSSYRLPGVTQVDLRQTHGLTVGEVWRAARDVDVLHIERVCDAETAELAVSAAEADALALAAINAPDAIAALSRLAEFGVSADRIGRAVAGVLAQRLVRKICSGCKEFYEVDAREMRRFGFRPIDGSQMVQLARGLGCEACRHTGYRERVGLFEILTMNPEVAGMIAECGFGRRLEEVAKGSGMQSLRQDGLLKILEGFTTPDEVMRVQTL